MTRPLLLIVAFSSALSLAQTESPPPMVTETPSSVAASSTPERVLRKRPRLGLVIGGAATFAVSYGLTAGASLLVGGFASLTGQGGAKLFLGMIPVVGPLFVTSEWGVPALVSTALQVGGLLMLGAGFLFPSTTWVTRGGEEVTLEFGPAGVRGRF